MVCFSPLRSSFSTSWKEGTTRMSRWSCCGRGAGRDSQAVSCDATTALCWKEGTTRMPLLQAGTQTRGPYKIPCKIRTGRPPNGRRRAGHGQAPSIHGHQACVRHRAPRLQAQPRAAGRHAVEPQAPTHAAAGAGQQPCQRTSRYSRAWQTAMMALQTASGPMPADAQTADGARGWLTRAPAACARSNPAQPCCGCCLHSRQLLPHPCRRSWRRCCDGCLTAAPNQSPGAASARTRDVGAAALARAVGDGARHHRRLAALARRQLAGLQGVGRWGQRQRVGAKREATAACCPCAATGSVPDGRRGNSR